MAFCAQNISGGLGVLGFEYLGRYIVMSVNCIDTGLCVFVGSWSRDSLAGDKLKERGPASQADYLFMVGEEVTASSI